MCYYWAGTQLFGEMTRTVAAAVRCDTETRNYPFLVSLQMAAGKCWPRPRTDAGACFHSSPLLFVFWCSPAVEQPVRWVSVVDCEGWVNVGISWKWCLKCVLHRFLPEVYLLLYLLSIRLQTRNKRDPTFETAPPQKLCDGLRWWSCSYWPFKFHHCVSVLNPQHQETPS